VKNGTMTVKPRCTRSLATTLSPSAAPPEQREQLKQVLLALKTQHDSKMQANRGAEVVSSEERLNHL
jgi:hypothetical protein